MQKRQNFKTFRRKYRSCIDDLRTGNHFSRHKCTNTTIKNCLTGRLAFKLFTQTQRKENVKQKHKLGDIICYPYNQKRITIQCECRTFKNQKKKTSAP